MILFFKAFRSIPGHTKTLSKVYWVLFCRWKSSRGPTRIAQLHLMSRLKNVRGTHLSIVPYALMPGYIRITLHLYPKRGYSQMMCHCGKGHHLPITERRSIPPQKTRTLKDTSVKTLNLSSYLLFKGQEK